jgi:hypothetical protein
VIILKQNVFSGTLRKKVLSKTKKGSTAVPIREPFEEALLVLGWVSV